MPLDQATIEGPVFATVEPTGAVIKRSIALGSIIGEAIANAVVHRDYGIAGSDIEVASFDDMLEITSPGAPPEGDHGSSWPEERRV